MKATFTPGPWVWAMDHSNRHTTLRRSGSGVGDVVADPQADISDYGLSVNPWTDVSDADAALIASAPALLEALKEARAELEAYELELTGEGYNNLRINAAISQALGGE